MTPNESLRLDALRFPLIVLVVFIHAYEASVRFSGSVVGAAEIDSGFDSLRVLISQCIARVAVPLFFLIAGYLFAWQDSFSWNRFVEKLRSRVRTLFIPFVFWNLLALALLLVVQTGAYFKGFDSGAQVRVSELGPGDLFLWFFGVTKAPFAYQFWFIRDLMVLVLVFPVIRLLLGSSVVGWIAIACLGIIWGGYVFETALPTIEALFFFSLGVFVRIRGATLFDLDRFGWVFLVLFLALLVPDMLIGGAPQKHVLHRLTVLLGVASFLFVTSIHSLNGFWVRMRTLSASAFFVFAAHEPLLTVVRKIYYKLVGPGAPHEVFLGYLFCPAFVILILVAIHRISKSAFPRALNIVVGAR